eukprot:352865-Chlamydomonas_euryale.AAC.10
MAARQVEAGTGSPSRCNWGVGRGGAPGLRDWGEYISEQWTSMLAKHLKVDLSVNRTCTAWMPFFLNEVTDPSFPCMPAALSGSAAVGHVRPLGQSESSLLEAEKRPRLDPKEVARLNARKKAEETKAANMAKLAQGTKSITNFFKPRTK